MEPSLDKRLVTLLQMIAGSPAKPTRQFKVHTNGTLLNRHDALMMAEAGLTHLSISIDTANEKTFSELRGGAKLERIFRNVKQFCETCPEITVQFIATVTQTNVDEMDLLVEKGVAIGAKRFHFREMFHDPRSPIVDHQKMEKLLLPPGRFHRMKTHIEDTYGDRVGLFFVDSPAIRQYGQEAHRNSR
jgi:molybdenum cofactor biosynthesis enzyme MoaA